MKGLKAILGILLLFFNVHLTLQANSGLIGLQSETLVAEAEAEDGQLNGVYVSSSIAGYSGNGYVTGFDNDNDMVTVTVELPASDIYRVKIRYNSPGGEKTQYVLVNGESSTPVLFPDEPSYATVNAGIYQFNAGSNTISVKSSWGYMDVDKFEVYTVESSEFDIDPLLVDPLASQQTIDLYDFFKAQFGKRFISGQTVDRFEEIKSLSGSTPMIRNGDLSNYTEGYPYAWDNGHTFGAVDDGRVEEMISWYNSTGGKGIVAYQWHWHSPSGGNPGNNNFYTSNTSFDIRKAVVPGNQEYDDIIRDIDAIAVQLKKFQDANVPVVWRPLHEAGGGWFWWGAHGAEPCVALYDMIYERLMDHHQIHNLIWTWSTPEPAWYPGNERVDIVGHDSYPGVYNYSAQKYAFDNMYELTGGRKLVAMTENGPIPDPEHCFSMKAPWLWFMSWANLVFEQNSNAHIQYVYGHADVITLESDNIVEEGPWRSSLYPEDWYPGYADGQGRFLHDFSYAGYHNGTEDLPFDLNVVDITEAPYNADNTGAEDVTVTIQQALDHVGAAGGGIVYLPAGTYQIKNSSTSSNQDAALHMKYDNVVLRGAGPDSTFLFHNENFLRGKDIIHIRKAWSNWFDSNDNASNISLDLLMPTKIIPVETVAGYSTGDLVVLKSTATEAWIEEHGMAGIWTESAMKGVAFLRKIDSIDADRKLLIIDSPTRYPLKTRDGARVCLAREHIKECGIEYLSIGNLDNPKAGWDENSYNTNGTGAYDAHYSHAIQFKYAQDCWVRNVHSYKPEVNSADIHVLSNFLLMFMSRNITVDSCDLQKPQYEGGGGNGYMYTLAGNDCLIKNSRANHSRHNYDFKYPFSNGNVIHNCRGEHSKYSSDFHMYLSMSNLIDVFTVNEDYLESMFRPWGGSAIHGYSSTQSVFYNITGEAYHPNKDFIVDSRQFGWGYIIGTSGEADQVRLDPVSGTSNGYAYNTSPRDLAEGVGRGNDLQPQSLYQDQFKKRMSDPKPYLELFEVTVEVRSASTQAELEGCEVVIYDSVMTTDEAGSIVMHGVPEFFTLSIEKENYSSVDLQAYSIRSDTTLVFNLEEEYFLATFIVLDENTEEAMQGVQVTFNGQLKLTDSQGIARFTFHRGSYQLLIECDDYESHSETVDLNSDLSVTSYLTRIGATVKFRIRESGKPVYQASVKLGEDSVQTGSLGVALFEHTPVEASYDYTVRKDGFHSVKGQLYVIEDTILNIDLISDTVVISSQVQELFQPRIWPNPVSDILHIAMPGFDDQIWIRIVDIQGRMVKEIMTEGKIISIDTRAFPAGVYILQAKEGNWIYRKILLKQ